MGISLGSSIGGIDFSSLADQLIALERQKLNAITDKSTQTKSKKSMYDAILSELNDLRASAKALATPNAMKFVEATSSDTDYLTADAESTAAAGTYSVTVNQLATASRVTSGFTTSLGVSANANLNGILNSASANLGGGFTGAYTDAQGKAVSGYITINGQQIDVYVNPDNPTDGATNDTMQEVIDRINSKLGAGFASYDAATDRVKLTSSSPITVGSANDTSNFLKKVGLTTAPDTLDGANHVRTSTQRLGKVSSSAALNTVGLNTALTGTGTFTINGVDIDYDSSKDSLNDILSRINSKVSTISATYDTTTDRVILSSKVTGSLGVSRSDKSGNLLQVLGLLDSAGDSKAGVSTGNNASITIPGFNNGQPIYSTSNTVTTAIPGVTLNLKDVTKVGTPISVITARTTGDLKTKIQDFVSKYNTLMNEVSTRLTEEPIENASTTTTQRVGLLRGDTMLYDLRTRLTTEVTKIVEGLTGDYTRAGSLGITISKTDYKNGSIEFNADTFDAAMEEDFEAAYDVLFNDKDGDGTIDTGEGGMVPRLLDAIDAYAETKTESFGNTAAPKGLIPLRQWTLDRQVASLKDDYDAMSLQLDDRETVIRAQMLQAQMAIMRLQQNSGGSVGGATNALSGLA